MAKRRGFFDRFGDFFRDLFEREPRHRATPEEVRRFRRGESMPRRVAEQAAKDARDTRETRSARDARRRRERRERDPFKQIWDAEKPGRRGNYQRQREVFDAIPGMDDETPEDQEYLWRSYLSNMVFGNRQRNDPGNPFWDDIGMHPRDWDWHGWREAMGYKGRRR